MSRAATSKASRGDLSDPVLGAYIPPRNLVPPALRNRPFRMKTAARDARDTPAYSITEAARYLRVAPGTLRTWVVGRSYPTRTGSRKFPPLIHPPQGGGLLSFFNLVEGHVLRALRTEHGVPIVEVRNAIAYAEKEMAITHLLRRPELRTTAGQIFLEHYGELINLSRSGQLAMRKLLEAHLKRVTWDDAKLPVRLHPFVQGDGDNEHVIAIDPRQAFGRPIVARQGVTTGIIAERIDAGESVEELASDYDLSPAEIEEAVLYERAA